MQKKKGYGCFSAIFIIILIILIYGIISQLGNDNSTHNENQTTEAPKVKTILDVGKYNNKSIKYVTSKLGKPDNISKWKHKVSSTYYYPVKTLTYYKTKKNDKKDKNTFMYMNFIQSTDKKWCLSRITIYCSKIIHENKDILGMFGLSANNINSTESDNGSLYTAKNLITDSSEYSIYQLKANYETKKKERIITSIIIDYSPNSIFI